MNLKHYSLLKVAAIINMLLGMTIVIIGVLEFLGMIDTRANTEIESVGVQLSHLVFISGIFCAISGGFTVVSGKSGAGINLQMFTGVLALGWPIFVSISLFFSQLIICIRLLPATLSALFYVIAILIVKISNESLKKTHHFNPKVIFQTMGKRNGGIDIGRSIANAGPKTKISAGPKIQALGNLNKHRRPAISPLKMFFNNSRRRSFSISNLLYGGSRHRRGRRRFR
jgi:hypothetical protein